MRNASEETVHLLRGRFTGNEARLTNVASHKENWRLPGLLAVNPSSALLKGPSEESPMKVAQEGIDLGKRNGRSHPTDDISDDWFFSSGFPKKSFIKRTSQRRSGLTCRSFQSLKGNFSVQTSNRP
jgi:hypothetical protein